MMSKSEKLRADLLLEFSKFECKSGDLVIASYRRTRQLCTQQFATWAAQVLGPCLPNGVKLLILNESEVRGLVVLSPQEDESEAYKRGFADALLKVEELCG
jgi:hypothetical protein